MADRFFSEEGLETKVNRDYLANRLVSRINHSNLPPDDSTSGSDMFERQYASVAELLREETSKAWESGDKTWCEDMRAVIDMIVPIYGLDPEWLKLKLQHTLEEAWMAEVCLKQKVSESIAIDAARVRASVQEVVQPQSSSEKWNAALALLPQTVRQRMKPTFKSVDGDKFLAELERAQCTRADVGFTENTVSSAELFKHVGNKMELRNIDSTLRYLIDATSRGRFWATALIRDL